MSGLQDLFEKMADQLWSLLIEVEATETEAVNGDRNRLSPLTKAAFFALAEVAVASGRVAKACEQANASILSLESYDLQVGLRGLESHASQVLKPFSEMAALRARIQTLSSLLAFRPFADTPRVTRELFEIGVIAFEDNPSLIHEATVGDEE